MPYKDPEQKRANQEKYWERRIAEGYGKTLYARRRARFENEKLYRDAIEVALAALAIPDEAMAMEILSAVCSEADRQTQEAG